MKVDLPGEEAPERLAVREWVESHPDHDPVALAEAGYVAPHLPRPWGLDAGPVAQMMIDEELRIAGVSKPVNPIGIGWAAPTIIQAGTEWQKSRFLPRILSGQELWCQLFSEPGAGSDLASLTTKVIHDGDSFVISGQKIWTSLAHVAQFGILLARTDPEVPNPEGISYFICPMDTNGITVRPIRDMTGSHTFNEVFFDEVRLPEYLMVGEENRGWSLAKTTLSNERVSLSAPGAIWGMGPTAEDLIVLAKEIGVSADLLVRQRLAELWSESEALQATRARMVLAPEGTGGERATKPGPNASIRKVLADVHGKSLMNEALGMRGPAGALAEVAAGDGTPSGQGLHRWISGFLFSPALTIGGGTSEVQKDILAEKVLGMPKSPT